LALIASVDYEEKEEQKDDDASATNDYSYAVEVLSNRGREEEVGWEFLNGRDSSRSLRSSSSDSLSPLLGPSNVRMSPVMGASLTDNSDVLSFSPDNIDSHLYGSHHPQVNFSASSYIPTPKNFTSANMPTFLLDSLTPFLQYITLKRSLLFYGYHFRLAFSLLDQGKFTLAFYHLLLSTADCFTSLTIFPSLLMTSPFLLRCLFQYFVRRDVDRKSRKRRLESHIRV
jgi:hypothetical protein